MIYITHYHTHFDTMQVKNVWYVKCNNVEEKYKEFMREKAKEINIVINPFWLNLMNWENHNNHLSIEEYKKKEKQWEKILRQWNVDKFISEILKGTKENYQTIYL